MKSGLDLQKLKLKYLLKGLCVNPSPFKLIETFEEDTSVEKALRAFQKSQSKRKVIGVRTKSGQVYHLGENEIQVILNGLQHQSE